MMRAVRATVGLERVALPTGLSSATQALVSVRAAGVNRPDVLQHSGAYPARPGMTDILGLELAGVDTATGEELCALVAGGAYAEQCLVERAHCLPVPFSGPDRFDRAAALPETCFTVWHNLFAGDADALRGKSVFIHGGASGIGTTAIALANAFGAALVQTSARGAERCAMLERELRVVAHDYAAEDDWWARVDRADVVLDVVGGSYLQRNLALLRDNGRLVIIGFLESPVSKQVNMSRVLLKSLTITGSALRSQPHQVKADIRDDLARHVWPRLQDGEIDLPRMCDVMPLEDFSRAHEALQTSSHFGKIVLRP